MNNTRLTTRFQFVQYIEQRPQNTQKIDRWMKRLEAASLGVIAAFFLTALQVSMVIDKPFRRSCSFVTRPESL